MITLIFSKERSGTLNDASHQHWTALQQKFTSSSVCASLYCTFYLDIQLPVSCSFSPLAFPNRRDFCPQVRFTVYWKVAAAYKLNEEVAMQTNGAFHAIFHLSPRMGFVCESLCRFVPWFSLSAVWSYLKPDECYWSRDSTFLQGSQMGWQGKGKGKGQGILNWLVKSRKITQNTGKVIIC